ncbi:MAG: dTMP kinase [Thermodesulfobacteriota bacterium]
MSVPANRRGLLIAFEGIDGTGKSTQIRLLAERLRGEGLPVLATREPTDGLYGRRIRELFTNRASVTPEEELALFVADRREHVDQVIAPALGRGTIVLTDRYYFSTAAYQGALGHDPQAIIARNEEFAPVPDLVVLLTAAPAVGIHRVQKFRQETLNDFEQEQGLARVAAIFDGLERPFIRRIAAEQPVEAVAAGVWAVMVPLLREKGVAMAGDAREC